MIPPELVMIWHAHSLVQGLINTVFEGSRAHRACKIIWQCYAIRFYNPVCSYIHHVLYSQCGCGVRIHTHIHTHIRRREGRREREKALKPSLFFTEQKAGKRIQYLLASNDKNVYKEDKNSTVIGTFQKSFIPRDKIFIILDTVVNVHGTQQTARYISCLRKLIVQQQAAFGSGSLETVAKYTPQGK